MHSRLAIGKAPALERASAINLMLLGGGLSMIGGAVSLNNHNQRVACDRAHPSDPNAQAHCARTFGNVSGAHSGSGYFSSGSSYGSVSEGGISRGGFGRSEGHGGSGG